MTIWTSRVNNIALCRGLSQPCLILKPSELIQTHLTFKKEQSEQLTI